LGRRCGSERRYRPLLSASGEHRGAERRRSKRAALAQRQRYGDWGKKALTSEASAVGVGRREGHNGAWAHATDMENAPAHVGVSGGGRQVGQEGAQAHEAVRERLLTHGLRPRG
jgi:hypothetical protein